MIIGGKIKIVDEIGRGSFAIVYKGSVVGEYPMLKSGDSVAVKSIQTSKFSTLQEKQKLENEINLMKTMSHENIVKLYAVERTSKFYYLVMEYCETGDLHQFLELHREGVDVNIIRDFAFQIGKGLQYLNSKEIIHRDLKPQNIMIRGEFPNATLKIADFGFARFLHQNDLAETICGSPIYMAPEIQFNAAYTAEVDMWSVGVIIYEMTVGRTPFSNCKTSYELTNELRKLSDNSIKIPRGVKCPPELSDLVEKLLTIDPTKRITLNEYMNHPFFKVDESKEKNQVEINSRKHRFSFSRILKIRNAESFDKVLVIARSVADSIEALFTDCQDVGDAVLFDLLTTMCEFLSDVLNEWRQNVQGAQSPLEASITQLIEGYKEEASELEKTEMEEPKTTALQFLFGKGMECALSGVKAEQDGDKTFAKFKYSKAMDILCPLVFLVDRDDDVSTIRSLYDQLMIRNATPESSETEASTKE